MSPRRQSQLADRVEEFSLQLVVRKSGMHNQHRWHAIELCGYRFAAETNRSKHGDKSRDNRRLTLSFRRYFVSATSTRRLRALPFAVVLSATGRDAPKP